MCLTINLYLGQRDECRGLLFAAYLRAYVALAHVASTWPEGSPAALRACAHFTGVLPCRAQHERAHAGNKAAPLRLFYCSKAVVMAMHLATAPNSQLLHAALG